MKLLRRLSGLVSKTVLEIILIGVSGSWEAVLRFIFFTDGEGYGGALVEM